MTYDQRMSYPQEIAICRKCKGEIGVGEQYHQPKQGVHPMCAGCFELGLQAMIDDHTHRLSVLNRLMRRYQDTGEVPARIF